MKAAVLGYGPAGLIAAKVLLDNGYDVDVIGAGGKSVIGGAQYLHENIMNPHNTEPEGYIDFVKMGERDVYAQKIYPEAATDVSWDHYEGRQAAWALGPVYDQLWNYFVDDLIHDTLNGLSLTMLEDTERYDMIFSSIPAHALCLWPEHHGFPRVNIALVPWSPVKVPNVVMYSGRKDDVWYRTSNIFGEAWTEFGGKVQGEYNDGLIDPDGVEVLPIRRGFKPMGTNCNCHPEIVRIGRFGLWDRKVLLHHVPEQVLKAIDRWEES